MTTLGRSTTTMLGLSTTTTLGRSTTTMLGLSTLTTVGTTPFTLITIYSSTLTNNNPKFYRRKSFRSIFYYEAIQVNVSITGTYTLKSNSTMETYGYLYIHSFTSSNILNNLLIEDDDSGGSNQFQIKYVLQQNTQYVLVVTTYRSRVIGTFSIIGTGPGSITYRS